MDLGLVCPSIVIYIWTANGVYVCMTQNRTPDFANIHTMWPGHQIEIEIAEQQYWKSTKLSSCETCFGDI